MNYYVQTVFMFVTNTKMAWCVLYTLNTMETSNKDT